MFFNTVLLATLSAVCLGVDFEIVNNEDGPILVGIQGNEGKEHLEGGGFALQPGESRTVQAPEDWAGRFWPRTWCDLDTGVCATGNCGQVQCNGAGGTPPATLVEITLKGSGGLDYYDVSLVDGFNIEAAIEPVGATGDGSAYSCTKAGCQVHVNDNCPDELKVSNDQYVIACNSACNAFNTDQYCCRGDYGTPDTCVASTWPVNYPKYFKDSCPEAYSYAYDDNKSTFTCQSEKYLITLGG